MKLLPIQLTPIQPGNPRNNEAPLHSPSSTVSNSLLGQSVNGNTNGLDHRLPFLNHPELIWRYGPLTFSSAAPPTYPPLDFKNHLPTNLACDPRLWNKDDVLAFLRWCEIEFDLPHFDVDLFQMNGKALCLLTKQDLGERCPGAGDLIYNVLRWLIRDGYGGAGGQHLPQSPVTPHFPITPSWCLPLPPPQDYPPHVSSTPTTLHNSVTLSPAPSVDSQSGSPKQPDQSINSSSAFSVLSGSFHRNGMGNGTTNSGSNQSDSDVDDPADTVHSPVSIPLASSTSSPPYSPRSLTNNKPSNQIFFPENTNSSEPNTNGRLLWDFLQQLLNDSMQRYTTYITWKNRDIGVFKIVDPPGLAKLWGIQKNHLSMNYDKMSRALRYYYRVNILRKVQGERHCYQFLRNPSELKSIKNISSLRPQVSPTVNHTSKVKHEPLEEPIDEDVGPTDLSMNQNSLSRLQSPANIKEVVDRFQFPQDLSVSPMQLQVNMEAREAFPRHAADSLSNSTNPMQSQVPIKVEDAS